MAAVQWDTLSDFTLTAGTIKTICAKITFCENEEQHWYITATYERKSNFAGRLTISGNFSQKVKYQHKPRFFRVIVKDSSSEKDVINNSLLIYQINKIEYKTCEFKSYGHIVVELLLGWGTESSTFQIPNFHSALNTMYEQGSLTDVVIKTKGKEFKCHKVVLASRSLFFKTMFETQMKESLNEEINWVNVFDEKVVEDLLRFVYTGNYPDNLANTCVPLMHAANMCLMEDLKEMCLDEIERAVGEENVLEIWKIGTVFGYEKWKEVAMHFMAYDLKGDPKNIPNWNQLEQDVALKLASNLLEFLRIKISKKK